MISHWERNKGGSLLINKGVSCISDISGFPGGQERTADYFKPKDFSLNLPQGSPTSFSAWKTFDIINQ